MGFFAFVAAYGGEIAMAAAAASAVAGAVETREQGIAASKAATRQAHVEAEKATQKQIEMRQNMLRALATQNAASKGAVGTGFGSSFAANVGRQIKESQNDLSVNAANASVQQSLLEQQSVNASEAGSLGALETALKGAGSVYQLSGPSKTPPPTTAAPK